VTVASRGPTSTTSGQSCSTLALPHSTRRSQSQDSFLSSALTLSSNTDARQRSVRPQRSFSTTLAGAYAGIREFGRRSRSGVLLMLLRPFLTSHPLARASHRRSPRQASTTSPLGQHEVVVEDYASYASTPPTSTPPLSSAMSASTAITTPAQSPLVPVGCPKPSSLSAFGHQRCRPTIPACLIRCGRRVEVRPLLLSISRSGIVSPLSIFPSPPIHVSLSILFHSHLSCSDRVVFVKRRKGKSIGSHKEYGMPHRQSPLEFPRCSVRSASAASKGPRGDNAARRRWVARQWPKDGARVT
jgi:hypothetical protein